MRSVLAFGLLIASVLLPTPQGCITPNRDMSSFVPAKVWTHAFRRSCKTRRLATTIHPNSAGADLRRPERIARNRATMSHCRDATSVHSPDLNPIDRSSPSSSHLLRKAAARWPKPNCNTIGEILRAFAPTECTTNFRNSAYAQSQKNHALEHDAFRFTHSLNFENSW